MKKKNTNQKNGLWTASSSYGEIGATLKALQDNGVTLEHLARLRGDNDYAKRVAEFMGASIPHKLARNIMGKNFWGVEEWLHFYGVSFTNKQLREAAYFPWNDDVLNTPCPLGNKGRIRETHIAFLGIPNINGKPLTILQWHKLHNTNHPMLRLTNIDKDEKLLVESVCAFRWYLMPIRAIFSSAEKTTHERLDMLPQEYEFSRAILEVTKNILYYRKNGAYPISENESVWCCDIIDRFMHVYIIPDYYYNIRQGIAIGQSWKTPGRTRTDSIVVSRKPGV
ncbi:MAG: hypothetical protein UV05_C0027G0002 [candidate division CPR1 bacterium GW2011_GWA2_42_17]|uniref:Uncharacterized protein n=1 Tax=candidate division CPR1 bacterium GW2011_GWA2_42_17 TaxID=1618341 RepID=A0A0G1BBC1_9BACT|nr:MAG: hypothetical protein UV05_C0027G0002 [candidate division CPR1 bacterium GW2011_GWA2_42_17]